MIQDLWVDDVGRLWVMMRVGDPQWETGAERVAVGLHRRPGLKITDYDSYWDTVVEVIDLQKGETIARRRFEKNLIKFLGAYEATGRTLFDGDTYRLPVYRLRLEEPFRGTVNLRPMPADSVDECTLQQPSRPPVPS
jgi:hypothetical protein